MAHWPIGTLAQDLAATQAASCAEATPGPLAREMSQSPIAVRQNPGQMQKTLGQLFMYRVSAFVPRFATALLAGATLATLWVNLAPASYYDVIEFRLADLPVPHWLGPMPVSLTPMLILTEGLMALFIGCIGKELWEALILDRGALRGRQAVLPLALALGGALGGGLVWGLGGVVVAAIAGPGGAELPGLAGWTVTLGADVALCYLVGRLAFGSGHPALYLLLAVAVVSDAIGLLAIVLTHPFAWPRLLFLALPALAALVVWRGHGRPPGPGATERQRRARRSLWPYLCAGLMSWLGVVAAGLPGAMGLLPVIPAIAHADRSFGLFAEVEAVLQDPLNRLTQALLWTLPPILFLFALLQGGVDLSAFAPETLRLLASLWLGRPLGVVLFGLGLATVLALRWPAGTTFGDMLTLAAILGMGFTVPLLAIGTALPGGAVAEAARLGLALSLLAGPMLLLLPRRRATPVR